MEVFYDFCHQALTPTPPSNGTFSTHLYNHFTFYRIRVWSLAMLVTHSLTPSLTPAQQNLIDGTLACEDAFSKLVEVITVADVSDEVVI